MKKTHKEILNRIYEEARDALGRNTKYAFYGMDDEDVRSMQENALEDIEDLCEEQDDDHVCVTLTIEEAHVLTSYARLGFLKAHEGKDPTDVKWYLDMFQPTLDKLGES